MWYVVAAVKKAIGQLRCVSLDTCADGRVEREARTKASRIWQVTICIRIGSEDNTNTVAHQHLAQPQQRALGLNDLMSAIVKFIRGTRA